MTTAPTRAARIVVLGSANLDLVVRQPRLPEAGETIAGSSFTTVAGGKGLNQAVAAARAGAETVFVGAVGPDEFGARLRAQLEADGIETSGLATVETATGTAHIAVLDGGDNAIVVVAGANGAVDALDEPARERIAGADTLLVQLERPLALVAEALAFARASGVRTVLTPAPAQPLTDELLELVDVLVPNEHEARALTGESDALDAARRLSTRAGRVVLTRGADGAAVFDAGALVAEVPARPVVAVDTTGAGDTFTGVLAARLVATGDWTAALEAASVAASIAVTRPGASSSMPEWSEIRAAL